MVITELQNYTQLFEGQTEATNAALERQTEGGFHHVLYTIMIPD